MYTDSFCFYFYRKIFLGWTYSKKTSHTLTFVGDQNVRYLKQVRRFTFTCQVGRHSVDFFKLSKYESVVVYDWVYDKLSTTAFGSHLGSPRGVKKIMSFSSACVCFLFSYLKRQRKSQINIVDGFSRSHLQTSSISKRVS